MNSQLNIFFVIIVFRVLTITESYSQGCDTATYGEITNLGLYGGLTIDYSFSNSGRLFAGSTTPASLFISDDTAKSWYKAFPDDSLEYECSSRGWGGGAFKVLCNQKGWVAAATESFNGTWSSAVISFSEGDTGSWKTAMDGYLLNKMGFESTPVNNIGLSDNYLYVALGTYIVRLDSSLLTDSSRIINVLNEIPEADSAYSVITAVALANSYNGYPFYILLDSTGSSVNAPKGKLYKCEADSFYSVSLPSGLIGANRVYVHPGQISGDTLFISGRTSTGKNKIYRSFNGGDSWTNISPSSSGLLKDVEYSEDWNLSSSNNLILINENSTISYDMGTNWQPMINIDSKGAFPFSVSIFPKDTNIVIAGDKFGSYVSENGAMGTYKAQSNDGFEAVLIWDIDGSKNNGVFYLATQSGLAYTTRYKDTSISVLDKWEAPYGGYPVDTANITESIYRVAIDPNDSTHVVVGATACLYVSFFAPDSFIRITYPGYGLLGTATNGISFVNSSVIIAITGSTIPKYAGNGDIWRSEDGGYNWSLVSPGGFGSGRDIEVAFSNNDTVIYVSSGINGGENGVLWISTNLGVSWAQVNTGPDIGSISDLVIEEIAVDPRGKDTIYLSAAWDSTFIMAKSTDGGLTYQNIPDINNNIFITTIKIHPDFPDSIIYFAGTRYLFQYNPSTDSSNILYTGLPGEIIFDLAIGSIFAGTTTGFYRINEDQDVGTYVSFPEKNGKGETANLKVYPNPALNSFSIEWQTQSFENLQIILFDLMGREIKSLYKGHNKTESGELKFDIADISSGTYLARVIYGQNIINQKIIISR
jgi:hypothetical protein